MNATAHYWATKRRYGNGRGTVGNTLTKCDRDPCGHREWSFSGSVTRRRTWRSGEDFYTGYGRGRQARGRYNVGMGMIEFVGYVTKGC